MFRNSSYRHRSRSKPGPGYEPPPLEAAEVSATHDWLQHRLGHLDSVEFAGDRDLVETPRTSRRSSVIQEERAEDSSLGMSRDIHRCIRVMGEPSQFIIPIPPPKSPYPYFEKKYINGMQYIKVSMFFKNFLYFSKNI